MCDLQGTEPGTVLGKDKPQGSLINKWKPREKFYYHCWIKECMHYMYKFKKQEKKFSLDLLIYKNTKHILFFIIENRMIQI